MNNTFYGLIYLLYAYLYNTSIIVAALPNTSNHIRVTIPPPDVPPSLPSQDFSPGIINQTADMLQYPGQTLEPGYPISLLPERTAPCGNIYTGRIVTILRGEPKVVGVSDISGVYMFPQRKLCDDRRNCIILGSKEKSSLT